jgi:hypothetical protein
MRTGTVVRRSPHYFKSRGTPKDHPDRTQVGIVTDHKFFPDPVSGVICFPVIHWEGGVMDTMTHPSLAVPFRRGVARVYVKVGS